MSNPTIIPGQPDGIEDDSRDLPAAGRAAERVRAYVSEMGDGLYDTCHGAPLYGRDLEALCRAVDAAGYAFGVEACVEGECDHVEGLGERCPTVEDRLATAEHAIEVDRLRGELDEIRELMGRGITDAQLREALGDLLGRVTRG